MRQAQSWLAVAVFTLSSALNALDRQLLAALAPTLRGEFDLTNEQYGLVVSAFSLVYALAAPGAGMLLDRWGLRKGPSIAVMLWSAAGMATAFTRSFAGLLACRMGLGVAESAGVPAAAKVTGAYLEPKHYAIGTAFTQVGLSIGAVAAPLMVASLAPLYGWRSVFLIAGALGVLWVPLWWWVGGRVAPRQVAEKPPASMGHVLRDRRMWWLAGANVFAMTLYVLWANWTTIYFVQERGLTEAVANRSFAWIPPVAAAAGGFAGGGLAWMWMRQGVGAARARLRVCRLSAVILLATAAVPWMPSPAWAAAAISLSYFWTLAISTNVYALPIDMFGSARAGLAVAMLTASYGLLQTLISPGIGRLVDRAGFTPVCVGMAVLPLLGVFGLLPKVVEQR